MAAGAQLDREAQLLAQVDRETRALVAQSHEIRPQLNRVKSTLQSYAIAFARMGNDALLNGWEKEPFFFLPAAIYTAMQVLPSLF